MAKLSLVMNNLSVALDWPLLVLVVDLWESLACLGKFAPREKRSKKGRNRGESKAKSWQFGSERSEGGRSSDLTVVADLAIKFFFFFFSLVAWSISILGTAPMLLEQSAQ